MNGQFPRYDPRELSDLIMHWTPQNIKNFVKWAGSSTIDDGIEHPVSLNRMKLLARDNHTNETGFDR
jgi:hypothetical protein